MGGIGENRLLFIVDDLIQIKINNWIRSQFNFFLLLGPLQAILRSLLSEYTDS